MSSPSSASPGIPGRDSRRFLMEHLAVFLELVESIEVVLWIRDLKEERILYVSPAFARIWGRSVEDLLRQPKVWIDSIHSEDRDRVISGVVSNSRDGADHMEYRIVRPDGSVRHIHDRAYPIRNAQGQIYRLAGVAEDVTDRKAPRSA